MPNSLAKIAWNYLPVLGLLTCVIPCGCESHERISVYSIPKHDSLQTQEYRTAEEQRNPKPIPRRTLGVIIPQDRELWFLKLAGNPDAVSARESDVRNFLQTLRFSKIDGSNMETLEWSLPSGWHELPANQLRYATLILDGQPTLEISVSHLPSQPDLELSDQLLANVNRWRGELSLLPIEKKGLETQLEKLNLTGFSAYWVNLEGTAVPKAAMKPPQPPAAPSVPKYEKPAEWVEAPSTQFAIIALQVTNGDEKLKITVSRAGGDRGVNVNRWRGQLSLPKMSPEELSGMAQKVEVGNETGDLYEMSNDGRTFFGVIVDDGDQSWFVKLDGNSPLAERERPRFMAFLKSLQLSGGK